MLLLLVVTLSRCRCLYLSQLAFISLHLTLCFSRFLVVFKQTSCKQISDYWRDKFNSFPISIKISCYSIEIFPPPKCHNAITHTIFCFSLDIKTFYFTLFVCCFFWVGVRCFSTHFIGYSLFTCMFVVWFVSVSFFLLLFSSIVCSFCHLSNNLI